jgi:(p)ppGpp synthase/HD superfamily hydrolase
MNIISRKDFFDYLENKVHPDGLALIKIAYNISKYGHRGQQRDDGTRYFEHPKSCAIILIMELEIYDYEMICGMLLHDIDEDSFILNIEEISRIFGPNVAYYVMIMTKPEGQEGESKAEKLLQYFHGLFTAKEKAKILKLVDRLHNSRTLKNCEKDKQLRKIRETIGYYLPLAWDTHRELYDMLYEICAEYKDLYSQELEDVYLVYLGRKDPK